jgi:hypothetical protein
MQRYARPRERMPAEPQASQRRDCGGFPLLIVEAKSPED